MMTPLQPSCNWYDGRIQRRRPSHPDQGRLTDNLRIQDLWHRALSDRIKKVMRKNLQEYVFFSFSQPSPCRYCSHSVCWWVTHPRPRTVESPPLEFLSKCWRPDYVSLSFVFEYVTKISRCQPRRTYDRVLQHMKTMEKSAWTLG